MRFAVHGPGIPEASPRSHGVPRRDVLCRVYVSVAGVSAGGAPEDGLALARLRVHLPARRAALARERGIDLLNSARRLVLQAAHQQAPPGPKDPTVQPGFLPDTMARVLHRAFRRPGHARYLEVFNPNHVEPAGDVSADLLGPVLAPVRLPGLDPRDGQPHPAAASRAPSGAGQLALEPPQPGLLPPGQARDVQQLPGGQGRTDGHAPVDPGDLPVTRGRDRSGNRRERDMPAARAVPGRPVGLHVRGYGAGPAEPDPPRLRDAHFPDMAGQAAHLSWPEGDDSEPLVLAGLAPGRPPGRVRRVEERSHRLSEIPQGLLLHHLRACGQPWVSGAGSGELPALLQVARRARAARTPVRVLLDREVPHVPGMRAVVPQHRLLGGRGKQAIPGHTNTLAISTDILGEVTRRFLSGLKAWVSTPRS